MVDDELRWETLEHEVAYTCPGFDVVNETVQLPDGYRTDFDYVSEPPTVAILPLTPEDDVLLIREWRQAVTRVNHGIPAGTVEPDDDTLEAAARRELGEETGHSAGDLEHLTTVEPVNGIADVELHCFLARECQPEGHQRLDRDEHIIVDPLPWTELCEQVIRGDVRDGRTVLAVSQALLSGRIKKIGSG